MLFNQHHDNVEISARIFWIGTLLTSFRGLNSNHDCIIGIAGFFVKIESWATAQG